VAARAAIIERESRQRVLAIGASSILELDCVCALAFGIALTNPAQRESQTRASIKSAPAATSRGARRLPSPTKSYRVIN
jgi:hypothetical protein